MLNLLYYILYIYIGLDQEEKEKIFDKCNCGFQLSCISGCCSGLCLLVKAVGKWIWPLKRLKDFCKQEKVSIMYVQYPSKKQCMFSSVTCRVHGVHSGLNYTFISVFIL